MTRFLFDKYYVKCGNPSWAVCGLAKALIRLHSEMYVNEALSVKLLNKSQEAGCVDLKYIAVVPSSNGGGS